MDENQALLEGLEKALYALVQPLIAPALLQHEQALLVELFALLGTEKELLASPFLPLPSLQLALF